MKYSKLEGIPSFSGSVIKSKIEFVVGPTFNAFYDVKVGKAQSYDIPSISKVLLKKGKIKLQETSFDDQAEVTVHKFQINTTKGE